MTDNIAARLAAIFDQWICNKQYGALIGKF